jgi:predicted nicotinamide N-methyase
MNETETKVSETTQASAEVQAKKTKVNVKEVILQFWPLFVAVAGRGGMLGFLFAGLAVFANHRILQSQLPQSQKVIYCIGTGIAAIAAYFVVAPIIIRLIS